MSPYSFSQDTRTRCHKYLIIIYYINILAPIIRHCSAVLLYKCPFEFKIILKYVFIKLFETKSYEIINNLNEFKSVLKRKPVKSKCEQQSSINTVFACCDWSHFNFAVNHVMPKYLNKSKEPHSHTLSKRKHWLNQSWNQRKNDKINVRGHPAGGYSGMPPFVRIIPIIVLSWSPAANDPKLCRAQISNQLCLRPLLGNGSFFNTDQ